MKKSIIIAALMLPLLAVQAQITVQRKHLVVEGSVLVRATDTTPSGVNIASGGASQSWDYSALQAHSKSTLRFMRSAWLDGSQYCPTANFGYYQTGDDTASAFLFMSDTELRFLGSYFNADGQMIYAPYAHKLLNFPVTYNGTFDGDSSKNRQTAIYLGIDPDDSGSLPTIDSFRPIQHLYNSSVIDGYGSMKTPLGTFNCLKQSHTQIRKISIEIYTFGNWFPAPKQLLDALGIGGLQDTIYRHVWWTNDSSVGFPLVEYSFAPGDSKARDVEWLQTKPQITGVGNVRQNTEVVLYPNPTSESLCVQFVGKAQIAEIEIYDMQGRICIKSVVTENEKIDLGRLEPGIYNLTLKIGDKVANNRFVKQ